MTIYDVIEAQRKALLDRDAVYLATVAGQWRGVEQDLTARSFALANQVAALNASGAVVSPARLARLERYLSLAKQAQSVIRGFAGDMAPGVAEQQQLAFDQGVKDAGAQLNSAGVVGSFSRLPTGATNVIIGTAADGSPLRALLEAQWPSAVDAMTKSLIRNTALGVNPRITAREMAASSGASLSRMLTVARTEQLRAYREASRATYQQAGIQQYKRLAAKNKRTCPTCLALDGKIYDAGEPMEIHPNDRCTSVPVVPGYKFPQRETGAEWFDQQDEATQRDVLGPGKLALYQSGTPLAAFVSSYQHPVWGPSVGARSLADVKASPKVVVDLGGKERNAPIVPTKPAQSAAKPPEQAKPATRREQVLQEARTKRDAFMAEHTADMTRLAEIGAKINVVRDERKKIIADTKIGKATTQDLATIDAQYKALSKERNTIEQRVSSAARSVFKVDDPMQIFVIHTNTFDRQERETMTAGAKQFGDFVSKRIQSTMRITIEKARGRDEAVGFTVRMSVGDVGTLWHEMGHVLEGGDMQRGANNFLNRRSAGERAQWMGDLAPQIKGWHRDEMSTPDKFLDPYMGKRENGAAAEIISMGFTYLYRNPHELLAKDPDYFEFLYLTLRGLYEGVDSD